MKRILIFVFYITTFFLLLLSHVYAQVNTIPLTLDANHQATVKGSFVYSPQQRTYIHYYSVELSGPNFYITLTPLQSSVSTFPLDQVVFMVISDNKAVKSSGASGRSRKFRIESSSGKYIININVLQNIQGFNQIPRKRARSQIKLNKIDYMLKVEEGN